MPVSHPRVFRHPCFGTTRLQNTRHPNKNKAAATCMARNRAATISTQFMDQRPIIKSRRRPSTTG